MLHLPTFEALRDYVRSVLCSRADVEPATPLLETDLVRGGRPCGIEYVLLGPRSLRLSAIWECSGGRLLFYDHALERFHTAQVEGPPPEGISAREREAVSLRRVWAGK